MNTSDRISKITFVLFLIWIVYQMKRLPGLAVDVSYWTEWALSIHQYGITGAYCHGGATYPPVIYYLLWIYDHIAGKESVIVNAMPYFRLLILPAEFAALWAVYLWTGRKITYDRLVYFASFNIAFWYTTMIWEQIDGIYSAFVFLAMYFVCNRRTILSAVMIMLAVATKLQAIVFIPVWGILCIAAAMQDKKFRDLIRIPFVVLIAGVLLSLPFLVETEARNAFTDAMLHPVGKYPFISVHAYNWWYWIFNTRSGRINIADTDPFLPGISYRAAGQLLFLLFVVASILPLVRMLLRKLPLYELKTQIWLACAAVSLSFFFWNTEMHERFCHTALIFLIAYAVETNRYFILFLVSFAYFLNLERVMGWLVFPYDRIFLFDARLVAVLYLAGITCILYKLYASLKMKRVQ